MDSNKIYQQFKERNVKFALELVEFDGEPVDANSADNKEYKELVDEELSLTTVEKFLSSKKKKLRCYAFTFSCDSSNITSSKYQELKLKYDMCADGGIYPMIFIGCSLTPFV